MSNPAQTTNQLLTLRLARLIGITSTAFFCGTTTAQSFFTTPALLLAPASLLAKQWTTQFSRSKPLGPATVLLATAAFSYLATSSPQKSAQRSLYTASAALLVATVPYTYFVGEPITQQLEARAAEVSSTKTTASTAAVGAESAAAKETVHVLVDRWALMNLGRVGLSGLAALLATWAAVL